MTNFLNKRFTTLVVLALLGYSLVFAAAPLVRSSLRGSSMPIQEKARVRAPEIQGGRGWLNTDKPLSLAAFKGKVVLLDFWTYGCINCIHIIPDSEESSKHKYANQLVVIGVHSAKFQNEKRPKTSGASFCATRSNILFTTTANSPCGRVTACNAWPTQVLIDPAGYIVGGVSGEGNYDVIDQTVAKPLKTFANVAS
jgi:thiol-disulfide isomerase/thioredoxin